MISSNVRNMKDGRLKVDGLTDELLARNMEFELRDARIDRRQEPLGNRMANFAGSEVLRVELRVQQEGKFQWERIEEFHVAANDGNPTARYINRRPRIYDVASESSFQIANGWLSTCHSSHDSCPPIKPVQLPTRVIDVGTSTSDQQKLIRTESALGHYAALSYCWGVQPQPLITTESNVETLYKNIPTSSLAKTIQEAIFVTRQLGLRYIWIDAICIIQDSAADRDAELSRMGEIYETATITIVAASAKHCRQGFLQRRLYPWRAQEWKSFKLPFSCPDGAQGELIIEPTDPYFSGDQPINHRGWTLQEFLLPQRKLIYSTTQLLWQCHSVQAELGNSAKKTLGIGRGLIKVQILPMLLSSHEHFSSPDQKLDAESLHDIRFNWQILVEHYSTRSLTNKDDILPAFSGIATKFARFLREEYKAGLWYSESSDSDFIQELLWNLRIDKGVSELDWARQNNLYTAPSWSWAGHQGSVSWQFLPSLFTVADKACYIEECSVQLAGLAPFGKVNGGRLRLRVKTRKLESIGTGHVVDDFQYMVNVLEDDEVSIFLDDTVEHLAARFTPRYLWCILLTVNGGLLVVPYDENRWVRIGMFSKKIVSHAGHTLSRWFENEELEEVTII
ncbi:HET-domain-containing protein [Hyaloscypha variabilis F]|uniref:HET-domain-containing protein n=1 Tax=Hyaloscypha variabilis (strain UAMH 11265 / GT02V1 / F) TaxID=1149755 RepID=A0A2J6S4G5_HYAVF|nr:HET-domain-containing protein [Hyaloscypha variabilis F]